MATGMVCPRCSPSAAAARLGHHHLVRAGRIRHPPARDGEAVLVEEEAVDAAHEEDVAAGCAGSTFPCLHERRGQRLVALDVRHLRVLAHCVREPLRQVCRMGARTAARRLDHEIRGVRGGQERRERRRGPPRCGDGAERHAAGQADEEDEHQVARSLPPPADDGPVPGGLDRRGPHWAGAGRGSGAPVAGGPAAAGSIAPAWRSPRPIANEVSRCPGLVVARASIASAPPPAGVGRPGSLGLSRSPAATA